MGSGGMLSTPSGSRPDSWGTSSTAASCSQLGQQQQQGMAQVRCCLLTPHLPCLLVSCPHQHVYNAAFRRHSISVWVPLQPGQRRGAEGRRDHCCATLLLLPCPAIAATAAACHCSAAGSSTHPGPSPHSQIAPAHTSTTSGPHHLQSVLIIATAWPAAAARAAALRSSASLITHRVVRAYSNDRPMRPCM